MAPKSCALCQNAKAILRRPKTGQQICKECFFRVFETEVHNTITEARLFKPGDRVAIGASGGKGGCVCSCFLAIYKPNICADSTVLAYVMKTLNERYQYGLNLFLLSIDEGITGYRDDSLEVSTYSPYILQPDLTCDLPQTVKRNQQQYDMPLKILSYHELYGWTMDRVVSTIGKKNNCTFCGVFRRQALDRGAATLGVDHIVTGHNADDIAETVLMNSTSVPSPPKTDEKPHIRGQSCEATSRGSVDVPRSAHREKTPYGGPSPSSTRMKRRSSCMPSSLLPPVHSAHATDRRYAYFKKLDYFSTECIYSPDAYRGHARAFLKDLEAARPSAIIDIIHSGEAFEVKDEIRATQKAQRAYISSPIVLLC